MSIVGPMDDPCLVEALASLLQDRQGGIVATHETVSRRVVFQQDRAVGGDGFGERRFALSTSTERLGIEIEARIYEEVRLHKTLGTQLQTVSATLRREQAEIEVDQNGDGSLTAS